MTFCVGWKAFNCVYLFADTLLTRFGTDASQPITEKTSFAELQGEQTADGAKVVVEEAGLKIREFGSAAITYAGSVKTALALADTVQHCMEQGESATDALNAALINIRPIEPENSAILLLACFEEGKAKLFRLDTEGGVEEVDELSQEGSIGACHQQNVESMLVQLKSLRQSIHSGRHSPQSILICITAILQSLGIHDYLPSEGVGGAFVGVCVSDGGVEWQPDALFLVHAPMPTEGEIFGTGVFIRDQVLCLISSAIGVNKYIPSDLKDEKRATQKARALAVADDVLKKFDAGKFQYLVFLNTGPHVAAVLQVNGGLQHQLAIIDAESILEGKIGVLWTPTLINIVNEIPPDEDGGQPDMALWWLPFTPASEMMITQAENIFANIREAEIEDW